MTKDRLLPYYTCFVEWLMMVNPAVGFQFQRGMMNADQIKPYLHEWAQSITKPKT